MKLSFKGGVHPLPKYHHGKYFSQNQPIEILKAPAVVSIPCSQHVGAPARPIVSVGDRVLVGQKIGEAVGFVSVPVHASVSGIVKEIVQKPNNLGKKVEHIVIENDFQDEVSDQVIPKGSIESLTAEEIKNIIKEAGNVGLGGAGFPTHVKLSPQADKKINTLIINGAECEPFLTADYRMMLEHAPEIVEGINAVMKALDVKLSFIGVEDNKPEAIKALTKAIGSNNIHVKELATKYPQGSEKQLIETILGRVVPSGGLPMDVGVVVLNVSSAKSISDAIRIGMPLIERVVTVTGGVAQPKNLMARIGTPLTDLVDACGGLTEGVCKIVSGGPMMGQALEDLSGVVTKGTSGIVALDSRFVKPIHESNCIRCGRCVSVCPIGLRPLYISAAVEHEDFEKAKQLRAMDCMSCGSCSYICPAKRDLAHLIRLAKDQISAQMRKEESKQR